MPRFCPVCLAPLGGFSVWEDTVLKSVAFLDHSKLPEGDELLWLRPIRTITDQSKSPPDASSERQRGKEERDREGMAGSQSFAEV